MLDQDRINRAFFKDPTLEPRAECCGTTAAAFDEAIARLSSRCLTAEAMIWLAWAEYEPERVERRIAELS